MTGRTPLPPGLGAPATRALDAAGIRCLEDVTGRTERDLLALHGLGPRSVRLLAGAITAAGMDWSAR